ncbi:Putative small secreted protein (plasmid) [Candidatus Trichorickettsia mobilis]|nr:entericidin A/B family lipoprotein [Candidatus Trichorickettsia mobilis]WPY01848.1 Putative small secreted protein [Candidatus Trichorickettsia mobilis]
MPIFKSTILVLVISLSLCSCNTFEGMGKDIKNGGKNIEGTANKHK